MIFQLSIGADRRLQFPLPNDTHFRSCYDVCFKKVQDENSDDPVGEIFLKALDEQADDNEELPEKALEEAGDACLSRQELDAAIKYYSGAIDAQPRAELYLKRGVTWSNRYYNLGKSAEDLRNAVKDYTKAVEINPQYGEAFFQRAGLWREWGLDDKAINDLSRSIELNEKRDSALFSRALAHRRLGRFTQAIADLNKSIELKGDLPGAAITYIARGEVYVELGDLESAIADFSRVIEAEPRYPGPYLHRARAWRAKGDLRQAIGEYTLFIERLPSNGEAYTERGYCHANLGNEELAVRDFERAANLESDFSLLQTKLREERKYNGPIDGRFNNELKAVIRLISQQSRAGKTAR
jgi:tetratricopeptide (TPR) repeat protein